jgi:antitoxin ParD1/3/4
MKTLTMNIALNSDLKNFIDTRVLHGGYSSHSEYVRDLVRQDERMAAEQKMRNLLIQGLESPLGPSLADAVATMRQRAASAVLA